MASGGASLRVDFSKMAVRPTLKEVMDFLTTKLCLAHEQVTRIHLRTTSTCAFIDVKDQSLALKIVEEHDGKHALQCQGTEVFIPITMDDGSVLVKLHDLSPRIADEEIKFHFQKYGKVIHIFEGCWNQESPFAGLPNGYRFVRIVAAKPIPSYVEIRGETTLATHRGQKPTCRYCGQHVHYGITCNLNRRLVSQKNDIGERLTTTYAQVAAAEDTNPHMQEKKTSNKKLPEPIPSTSANSAPPKESEQKPVKRVKAGQNRTLSESELLISSDENLSPKRHLSSSPHGLRSRSRFRSTRASCIRE